MQTQTIMVLEDCSRCGQPIAPGEPAMQTASVDLNEYGRAVSSPVKSYHLSGRCYEDHRAAEKASREAQPRGIDGSDRAAPRGPPRRAFPIK